MSKELLAATYDLKRFQMMEAFMRDSSSISAPLVYAYDKRIAPIHHNDGAVKAYGFDPFNDVYYVDTDTMQRIANHLGTLFHAEDLVSARFDRLEEAFGGYKTMRMELTYALRYFFLNGLYSEEFFKAVMSGAPVEAHSIMDEYKPGEVFLD
jgi:hypothetical protein